MAEEKDNNSNYDDKGREKAVQTVTHSTTVDSLFTTSNTWAEENGVDACDRYFGAQTTTKNY